MNRHEHQFMSIIQKIPVFKGLSFEQASSLIRICIFQKFAPDTQIYSAGDASDDFLVLISGKLSVMSPAGQKLGELNPGVSIGEMGVFTGHVRSATVVAVGDCAGLVISKGPIYQMMEGDQHFKAAILGNVIEELSDRLAESNDKVAALMRVVQESVADASAAATEPETELPEEEEEEPAQKTSEGVHALEPEAAM